VLHFVAGFVLGASPVDVSVDVSNSRLESALLAIDIASNGVSSNVMGSNSYCSCPSPLNISGASESASASQKDVAVFNALNQLSIYVVMRSDTKITH
jgi:hypothetical protein